MEGGQASARPIYRRVAAIVERQHAVLVSCEVLAEILTGSWCHDHVDGRLEGYWLLEVEMSYQ
jgi:hypothetical protein